MMKHWCAMLSENDINGGIVLLAEDKDTALQVFKKMFGHDKVIIQQLKIF